MNDISASPGYAFGDSDLAANRLKLLAEVFAASSHAFVRSVAGNSLRLAVDLGCGPGYSTHLLADTLACEQAAGLDCSEPFLARAGQTRSERVSFHLHDVTETPFPVGPADLLYCRFLLPHLRDPETVIAGWATQLRPRGLLLMEETEWIRTDTGVFKEYLAVVEAMLAYQSNTLYVGPVLDGLGDREGLRKRASRVTDVRVPAQETATLFFMNLQTWKERPFIREHYDAVVIDELAAGLEALTRGKSSEAAVEFGLRQVVYECA